MVFERIKSIVGASGRDQRYVDVEDDFDEPQDVENPHTTVDGTQTSWRDVLIAYKWVLLAGSVTALALLGVVIIYGGRYFITTASNPWVQRGVFAAAIFGAGWVMGGKQRVNALRQRDKLVLRNPETGQVWRFLGKWEQAKDGDHDVFVPFKGFRYGGISGQPYEIRELSTELVKKYNHSPDAPARIRIHPSLSSTVTTNTGRLTVQSTAGIEPDPFGRESNLIATVPEMASESTVSTLKALIRDQSEEIEDLENRNEAARRRHDQLVEELSKSREEVRDEFQKLLMMVYPLASGSSFSLGNLEESNDGIPDTLEDLQGMLGIDTDD